MPDIIKKMMDPESPGMAQMLGSIFKTIQEHSRKPADLDGEYVARAFENIADGLRGGLEPNDIAMICDFVAQFCRAAADPKRRDELLEDAFQKISEATKKEGE